MAATNELPMGFVLDCSVAMAWCFEERRDESTLAVLGMLGDASAVVPQHWYLEVANVLVVSERRGLVTAQKSGEFLSLFGSLPLVTDGLTAGHAWDTSLQLARNHGLTSYDAAYLELALRRGLPLATRDKKLVAACKHVGIRVI